MANIQKVWVLLNFTLCAGKPIQNLLSFFLSFLFFFQSTELAQRREALLPPWKCLESQDHQVLLARHSAEEI